jgi:ketosteroid isomerase-like protein
LRVRQEAGPVEHRRSGKAVDGEAAAATAAVVRDLRAAIRHGDAPRVGELVVADAFVLGAPADAVCTSRPDLVADLRRRFARAKGKDLRVRSSEVLLGVSDSGHSAWFFDRFVVEVVGDHGVLHRVPIRLTGLLVRNGVWRLAAAHWSVPLPSNEYQYALLEAGTLPAGIALQHELGPDAQPLARRLEDALARPRALPALYATRQDAVTIGSAVDEVFLAAAGQEAWRQFVSSPPGFAVRGGLRGAMSPDGGTAWLATHIDITFELTTPYRFFFIWVREQDDWKIVVSHDSVSVDPAAAPAGRGAEGRAADYLR